MPVQRIDTSQGSTGTMAVPQCTRSSPWTGHRHRPHRFLSIAEASCFLFILLLCGFTLAEDAANNVAEMVENALERLGGKVVVVLPFPYVDGIKSVEGALIAERITTLLSEHGFARVVERAALDKIMDEQKLSAMGFVDPASSVQVGRLLGARGILSGTVTDLGEKLELHVRLLNVETGEAVVTRKLEVPKTIKTFISPLWKQMDRIKKGSTNFTVKLSADRESSPSQPAMYRVGDFVTLHFEADRDCYVTIFDFTTSGSVNVLFPNAFVKDNRVKAHRTYTFPDAQAGFKIRVNDPPGIERVRLFATTQKIPLFTEDYSQEKFRSLDDNNYSVSRDLEAIIESLEDNAWGESQFEMRIEQILR